MRPEPNSPDSNGPTIQRSNGPAGDIGTPAALTGAYISTMAAMLNMIATPAVAKSKSTVPTVPVDSGTREMLAQRSALVRARKDAEAEIGVLDGILAPKAEALREEVCRSAGYTASVSLGGAATYTQAHRYRTVPLSAAADLATIFDGDFARYFAESNEVKVKADSLSNELLAALVAACAKAGVKSCDVFEVKQTLRPTTTLTQERVTRADTSERFARARAAGLVEPAKPTIGEG